MERILVDIEAFYEGEHVSSNGNANRYTAEDIQSIADNYNARISDPSSPDPQKAPVVLGHPQHNEPRFGEVLLAYTRLDEKSNKLSLWLKCALHPDIVEWISQGFYRERSLAILDYGKGRLDIEHLGMLGASYPALTKLRDMGLPINNDIQPERHTRPVAVCYTATKVRYSIQHANEVSTMDEAMTTAVSEMIAEQVNPVVESLNSLREAVEKLTGEPIEETDAAADAEADPEEEENARATVEAHAKFTKQIDELRNENRRVVLNAERKEFTSYLNDPERRARLNDKQRDNFLAMYDDVATRADFSKGEPKEVTRLKETIDALEPKVSLHSQFTPERAGETDRAKAEVERLRAARG